MGDVDMMLKWSEDLKNEINDLPFKEDDVRKDFLGLLYDIGYTYYRAYMLFDIMYFMSEGRITFDESVYHYKTHFERGMEIAQTPGFAKSYYNSLNRNFLVSTWSNFELCVTTLCDAISTEEEKSKLLEYEFNELKKVFKKTEIVEDEFESFKEKLVKGHLTHVPITRKTDFLFKKAENYPGNLNEDKAFLIFFGKFRNTIHTNFIYHGKDYEYNFLGKAKFVFKNNEIVKWGDIFGGSPILYFEMKTRLKEIWKNIVFSIKHEEIIYYPVLEQE